jgi:hypothetical protein
VKNNARTTWARTTKVGQVRTHRVYNDSEENDDDDASTDPNKANGGSSNVSKTSYNRNGSSVIDPRLLPKLEKKALTVKHPGMESFTDSMKTPAMMKT